MTSDPSSSYPSSRRSPPVRGANKSSKAGGATGFTSPAFLNIVSAATTAAVAAPTADGECQGGSQSSDPPPASSCRNTPPPKDDTSGDKSGVLATSETEGENGGGEGRECPKPPAPSISLTARPPDEAVRRIGSPKSEASSSKGGDGGGRSTGGRTEDAVVDVVADRRPSLRRERDGSVTEKTTVPQPRRPSGAKPSKTSEGRSSRPQKFTPGGESGSRRPSSDTPNNSGKRYSL